MSDIATLERHGIVNAGALVKAAAAARCPLWIAAAMIDKESNGDNVYGHDSGGVFSAPGRHPVTRDNFKEFRRLIDSGRTSNGVGPAQITWKPFFRQAESRGLELWKPYDNMLFGFGLLADYLNGSTSDAAIRKAGKQYNGADAYGVALVATARTWRRRLGASGGGTAPTTGSAGSVLEYGDTGAAVKKLQAGLNAKFGAYSDLAVDGSYGPSVRAVVKEFQRRAKADGKYADAVDGIVGPNTRRALAAYGVTL